ncbi:hypothetical protein PHYBOEH_008170 [Phytophthora boehmeriae]|uniref:Uncharacterized protein n=1 Tax=Phytophthora boehmeriae TaxID=109152 RepID=A0A8T1W4U5_9STRA|nr:hypothetical protein PHYBOEH_008170 [Phytophthora boehmeriae]
MGCCSSKSQLATVSERQPPSGGRTGRALGGGGGATLSNGPQPSNAEKRERAAEAAENRRSDWRQGGNADPEKARSIAQRREKDELLAKIYNRYTTLGKEPPIGLPSCDLDQLRRHLETLR